jgi:hypothetical protein
LKIIDLAVSTWKLVASYPALTAGVFQVIIIAGAQIGWQLTTPQLSTLAGTVAAVFAILVHMGVIPVTKVANVKAGLKPDVPKGVVAVGTGAQIDPKPVVVEGYPSTLPVPPLPSLYTSEADMPPFAVGGVIRKTATETDVKELLGIDPIPVEVVPEAITTIEAKPVAPDAHRLGKPITPNRGKV